MGGLFGGGGGGGGSPAPAPAPSSQTVTNTSIPAYAQPYVENMLGQTQALTDINQNPYQTYGGTRIAEFSPLQQQAFANVTNQTTASQLTPATGLSTASGFGSLGTTQQAGGYGGLGAGYGAMAAGMAPQAQQYGQTAADIGTMGGIGYGAQGMNAGLQAAGYGSQGANIGQSVAGMSTNPYAQQAYMSPYIQNALQPQLAEMTRQYDITGQQQRGQANAAGAFGGSRDALMRSENQRNKNMAMNLAIGQGYQSAFDRAQQQMNQAAQLGMQGTQQGIAGQQAAMQGAGVGLQGIGTALQGQQAGLQGLQQAGNLYGQGMTGAQVGLQGVGAQQAGYAGANQAAGTLGQLGQTQFGQQQQINQAQQTTGAVQQAQAQQALDQSYQDFMKQKNYPYQQLAFMSDMLRGLPLSQSAQSQYTAPPNMASQLGGLGMAGLGIYGMSGGFKAKGGMVGKGHAEGGLMAAKRYKEGGYAFGGDISALNVKQLQEMLDNPTLTPQEVEMIEKRIMLLTRMANNPQAQDILAPEEGQQMAERSGIGAISTGDMVPEQMAGGGIVAFAEGGQNKESYQSWLENQVKGSIQKQLGENAFARSDAEKAKLEQAIAARQERSPYEALAMAGLGTMAGTSQYGLTNLGLGATEGLKSYSKNMGAETSDRQKMLEAQMYADKAEEARKSGLTGQMQTTLGQLYAKQAAQAAAGSGRELANLTKVGALIDRDPVIKSLEKQRVAAGAQPGTPEYEYFDQRIAERENQIYNTYGVKVPEVVPSKIAYPKPEEKPGLLDRIFGSSKPAAAKSPGVMRFDKNGNPI
jgi:hypothetical protein